MIETTTLATNLLKPMNPAPIEPAVFAAPQRSSGQILRFPSGMEELNAAGEERRDGLGCAVAVRLVLGFDLLVAASCYGIWRFLH
jgi:hypothetical protein